MNLDPEDDDHSPLIDWILAIGIIIVIAMICFYVYLQLQ
jgi:hypothetical protein